MDSYKVIAIIPARMGSSRLPGKPLADICGRPMILRVVERVKDMDCIQGLAIATDSLEIAECVEAHGYRAIMTDPTHPSGSDRIAQAAAIMGLDPDDIVVNIQGDQPFVEPAAIKTIIEALETDQDASVATAACPLTESEARDPNRVKVVIDGSGRALYFSRSLIPFDRDGKLKPEKRPYLRHLGLYAYRMDFLQGFVKMEPGRLESIERLEQLRILENGYGIAVRIVQSAPIDVDTAEDLEKARLLFKAVSQAG